MLVISVNRVVILFVKNDNIRINIFALRTSMTCLHHDLENVKMQTVVCYICWNVHYHSRIYLLPKCIWIP